MRHFVFAALLVLQACASLAPPPAAMLHSFGLQGRVSVLYDGQSMSGQLDWRAGAESDELMLSSPLGQGVAGISRNAAGVTLARPGAAPLVAENVETLTEAALGFRLPLAGLRFWVQALPDPARASEVRLNAAGGMERIVQDGWQIDYLQFHENRPRKIHVTREGLEIRLVIDAWQTN